jgi:hypothetical protein
MKQNPPSKGFNQCGGGSFANAYRKDDRVELILRPTTWTHKDYIERYDLSRELLIIARRKAPPEARKHIPDIKRERIDINDEGGNYAEIVYSMPYYGKMSVKTLSQQKAIHHSYGIPDRAKGAPQSAILAYKAIQEVGIKYSAVFDLSEVNFSESKDGDLIFRDPFHCAQTGYESIKLEALWPGDQFAIFQKMMPNPFAKEKKIYRNPPSRGFNFLNRGSFAHAYEKNGAVELMVRPRLKKHGAQVYDLSRELLIMARQSASDSAKKYIPDIKRERIDIVENEDRKLVAEIVYSMPEYESFFSTGNVDIIEMLIDLELFPELSCKIPKGLIEASRRIFNIGRKYGASTDLRHDNFSQSESGDLIIRDPLVCMQTGYEDVRLSELWPADQFAIFSRLMLDPSKV